jgi:2-polyprenyl-3-methyl-5-hydroxy-6-metoxy-1,4-benzoquinol methylase
MVRAFSSLGVDSTGIEVDSDLVVMASALGANVRHADICTINPAEYSTWDVICMSQVLEHILTPRLAIKNISLMLRPGGILHVDVPNSDSWGGECAAFIMERQIGA